MTERLPWAPIEAATPSTSTTGLARRLGVDRRQVRRWRSYGVTAAQADRLAVRLGRHPVELWPEWGDALSPGYRRRPGGRRRRTSTGSKRWLPDRGVWLLRVSTGERLPGGGYGRVNRTVRLEAPPDGEAEAERALAALVAEVRS